METEEGDPIPTLVMLGFSTGLAPQDAVEEEWALQPEPSLVSEPLPLSLLIHQTVRALLTRERTHVVLF